MFEHTELVQEALTLLNDPDVSDITKLRIGAQMSMVFEAVQATAIASLAIQDGWEATDGFPRMWDDGPQLIRVSDDGVPIDETLPLDIAAAKHISVGTASWMIRDIVHLKTRHPFTWEAIHTHQLPLWQAQHVTQNCTSYELTAEQTFAVDAQIGPALGKVGPKRLKNLIKAAVMNVAPEQVEEIAARTRKQRYVTKEAVHDDPATTTLYARLDTSDAVFFDSTIDRMADILAQQGDDRDKDHRRAAAVGILATPALALSMLGVDTDKPVIPTQVAASALPTTQIHVIISDEALLDDNGLGRVEKIGPVLTRHLTGILGHSKVRVTPIIYVTNTQPGVDAYEIPARIREQVIQRDRYEVFPFSSREARRQDLDHTLPYARGKPNQTRADNLGPLSRKAHRAKTFDDFQLFQTEPGVFWWKTRRGQIFRVGPDGTTDHTPKPFCQTLKEEPPPF